MFIWDHIILLAREGRISQLKNSMIAEDLNQNYHLLSVTYDTAKHKWTALNYYLREIKDNEEDYHKGKTN